MHLHLDAIGGIAGDMFAAALTDAFPGLRPGLLETLRQVGLPSEIACGFEAHNDGVLSGSRFTVGIPKRLIGDSSQGHTPFAEIKSRINASPIEAEVKERATDIFQRLAEVEAKIHGTTTDQVGFHELGGWDSVADMVGAAYLIAQLKIHSCTVSNLPLGSGRVKTSHGPLPVPVPAVARLLEGFDFFDDGVPGERITPTGASILRHLGARQSTRKGGRLSHTGYGFGTKRFAGISNVLRVLVLEETGAAQSEQIGRVTFEVDDQTPEDLAIGLDRIREMPGVVDVIQVAAFGKKGRMSMQVQILTQPSHMDAVCQACLKETTTLGVRHELLQRVTLARTDTTVEAGGHKVRVKLAERPHGPTAKAESDDVRKAAGTRSERDSIRNETSLRALNRGNR